MNVITKCGCFSLVCALGNVRYIRWNDTNIARKPDSQDSSRLYVEEGELKCTNDRRKEAVDIMKTEVFPRSAMQRNLGQFESGTLKTKWDSITAVGSVILKSVLVKEGDVKWSCKWSDGINEQDCARLTVEPAANDFYDDIMITFASDGMQVQMDSFEIEFPVYKDHARAGGELAGWLLVCMAWIPGDALSALNLRWWLELPLWVMIAIGCGILVAVGGILWTLIIYLPSRGSQNDDGDEY